MSFLVDTNVILRTIEAEHPMCADALAALGRLRQQGENLYFSTYFKPHLPQPCDL